MPDRIQARCAFRLATSFVAPARMANEYDHGEHGGHKTHREGRPSLDDCSPSVSFVFSVSFVLAFELFGTTHSSRDLHRRRVSRGHAEVHGVRCELPDAG